MDYREFVCLEWKKGIHLAMTYEYCQTRYAKKNGHAFSFFSHTPTEEYKKEHPHARSYEHYMIDGKTYKSRKKLIEALEKLD